MQWQLPCCGGPAVDVSHYISDMANTKQNNKSTEHVSKFMPLHNFNTYTYISWHYQCPFTFWIYFLRFGMRLWIMVVTFDKRHESWREETRDTPPRNYVAAALLWQTQPLIGNNKFSIFSHRFIFTGNLFQAVWEII